MQGGVISMGLVSVVWVMAGQGGRAPNLPSDLAGPRGSRTAWALPSQNALGSADDFVPSGVGADGYAISGAAEDIHQRQLRRQERAMRNAVMGQSVPGSFFYVVESRGTAVEVPKTPAGEQFSASFGAFMSGDQAHTEAFVSTYNKH